MDQDEAARVLTRASSGRAALKEEARRLDQDTELRGAVLALARARGVELPEEAESWPGKRILRWSLDRQQEAQVRTNFLRRDEGFTCARCGAEVPPGGARVRDHCTRCLASVHLDRVPGDRAADCGAIMEPISVELTHGDWILTWRCEGCGASHRNRTHPDDDPAALARIAARAGAQALWGR